MHQFLHAQPSEQFVAIIGQHDALKVQVDLALFVGSAFADGQQRKIVVAQHYDAVSAQRMYQPEGFQRLPAAVDQVATEPKFVGGRIETQTLQQALGGVVASLQVADGPNAHAALPQCTVRGTDRVKAAMGASKRVPSSASMS